MNKRNYTFHADGRIIIIPLQRKLKIDKLIEDANSYKINGDDYVNTVESLLSNEKAYWQWTTLGCIDNIFEG